MLDAVRKYVEAGREALTPRKAEELTSSLVKQGEVRRDQASKLARDLAEWSRRNSERLVEMIRGEVKRQIAKAGLATKDEVDSLKRRIRELERGATSGTSGRSGGAAKSASRKRAAPKSPAPKSTAPKNAAPKSAAPKSAAPKSAAPRKRTT